jgi:hypothetical protein
LVSWDEVFSSAAFTTSPDVGLMSLGCATVWAFFWLVCRVADRWR